MLSDLIKEIQKRVGTTPDGQFGPATAKAVLEHLPEPEPTPAPAEPVIIPGIEIDARVQRICKEVLNVFETGSRAGNYAKVTIYGDGPNGARQITYGKSQTTEAHNLKKLLELYLRKKPDSSAAHVIKDRLPSVGKTPYKVSDAEFIKALQRAGEEPIMQAAQDEFFDSQYFIPACNWFKDNGFKAPLSLLVIYDSFIHSGGILSFLRKRFKATVPKDPGGSEKDWIQQYVQTRLDWLTSHTNPILRKTTYRMDTMQKAISENNWTLERPVHANGIQVS